MGTKNIRVSKQVLTLGGVDYELDYSMASFLYLAEKYGDVTKALACISPKEGEEISMSKAFLTAVADLIYAGVMRPDYKKVEAGVSFIEADESGLSPFKILSMVKPSEIEYISSKIGEAMNGAAPENPTTAAK